MENQHRKIVGYRELTQEEIDLMNEIKAKGKELLALHDQVMAHLKAQAKHAIHSEDEDAAERLDLSEPGRWASIGKTNIQLGIMALVRAVAQPTDC